MRTSAVRRLALAAAFLALSALGSGTPALAQSSPSAIAPYPAKAQAIAGSGAGTKIQNAVHRSGQDIAQDTDLVFGKILRPFAGHRDIGAMLTVIFIRELVEFRRFHAVLTPWVERGRAGLVEHE